jgi:hypothetical protein
MYTTSLEFVCQEHARIMEELSRYLALSLYDVRHPADKKCCCCRVLLVGAKQKKERPKELFFRSPRRDFPGIENAFGVKFAVLAQIV